MAHKSLVSGTAYNIVGGKSMVSGTTYNISGGRTMVGGTGYDINFGGGEATVMLYSSGNMVFQRSNEIASEETLLSSWSGFEDVYYSDSDSIPWSSYRNYIVNVTYMDNIAPVSMSSWYYSATSLKSINYSGFILDNVTSMAFTYYYCSNLTGAPVCGSNVTNMSHTYYGCTNLTGAPACGDKVTSMDNTYRNCQKLTGTPACGNNVTWMSHTYYNCTNLTGAPVCGSNVASMNNAYRNCQKLTGTPACGNNVTSMAYTYYNCYNLTGAPACGNNVTNMYYAYYNCTNLTGNAYFYSSVVNKVSSCFYNKNKSKRLNIYVPINSTTQTTVLITNTASLVGKSITYTNAGTYYYSATYNIYIYPVNNVAAARAANGD